MTTGDGLPPLREVIRAFGIEAKRSLGQNFLLDLNLTAKIARAAGPLDGVTVIEVGPGPGGLTRALLARNAARVVAIERDARAMPALSEIAAHYPGRLEILHADALAVDWASLDLAPPVRIVANLPYNVGTALLANWIEAKPWPPFWDAMVLMFQREVAERIVATPADPRHYGRLGVLCGWRTKARILFDIPAAAFTPPPKVVSSVVHFTPAPAPLPCRSAALAAVTRAAFGQRRKMLRQSLKTLIADPVPWIEAAQLDPTARAESIDIAGFARLARSLDEQRGLP